MRLELEGLRAAADREQELLAEVARANDRTLAAAEEVTALRQEIAERLAAAAAEEELRARVRHTLCIVCSPCSWCTAQNYGNNGLPSARNRCR